LTTFSLDKQQKLGFRDKMLITICNGLAAEYIVNLAKEIMGVSRGLRAKSKNGA